MSARATLLRRLLPLAAAAVGGVLLVRVARARRGGPRTPPAEASFGVPAAEAPSDDWISIPVAGQPVADLHEPVGAAP